MKTFLRLAAGQLFIAALCACATLAQAATMTPLPGASGQTARPYSNFPNPVGVVLKDDGGLPLANVPVTFSWSYPDAGGAYAYIINNQVAVFTYTTDAQGVAVLPALTASNPLGFLTITANAPTVSASTSIVLNVAGLRPAAVQVVSGDQQSTLVNTAFAQPLKGRALDAVGEAVPHAACFFSHSLQPPGGGTFSGFPGVVTIVVIADEQGIATSPTLTASGDVGNWIVSFSCSTDPPINTFFSLTNVSPSAPVLTAGGPYTVNTGAEFTFEVTLRDAAGNPLPDRVVGYSYPPEGSRASLDGLTAVTNAQGVARKRATANYSPGPYTFVASSEGVSTNIQVTNVRPAGEAAAMEVYAPSSTPTARPGTFFLESPAVRVRDASGLPVAGVEVIFIANVSPGANFVIPFPPALTNAAIVHTDAQGIATTPPMYAAMTAGPSIVEVYSFRLPGVLLQIPILAQGAAATRIEVVSGSGQTVEWGGTYPQPLVARVLDASGQPVPRAEVHFEISGYPNGVFAADPPFMTDANGLITTPPLRTQGSGDFTVTAVCCGGNVRAAFNFSSFQSPSSMTRVQYAGIAGSYPFTNDTFYIGARIVAGQGYSNQGLPVTFEVESVSGSNTIATLNETQAVTDENGSVSVTGRVNDWPGTFRIRARYAGTMYENEGKVLARTQFFIESSPVGGGRVSMAFTQPTCTIVAAERLALQQLPSEARTLPADRGATTGFATFNLKHCEGAGGRASLEIPTAYPANAEAWAYGLEPGGASPHWFRIPGATISGHDITFDVGDGGPLDQGPAGDGEIVMPLIGVLVPGATTVALPQVQDMWWSGAAENGWGMSVVQHGEKLFAVIYGYDAAGAPTWWVMSDGTWNTGHTVFKGAVYSPRGSPFFAYDPSRFVVGAALGTMTLDFSDAAHVTLAYTINGVAGTKTIVRQSFGAGSAPMEGLGDMWWGGASQNGWGISVLQQFGTLFSVWFTYDAAGLPIWYVMPGGTWNANAYEGRLYRTTGSPWLGAYDVKALRVIDVGSYRLRFDGAGTTFESVVDGRSGSIAVTRNPF